MLFVALRSRVWRVVFVLASLVSSGGAMALGVEYDRVVDVTGLPGPVACAAMQDALNDALGGAVASRRILIRGSLGTREAPVDFSMFHDAGRRGTSERDWPYAVCHAFWPSIDTTPGSGVVGGYPDPLLGRLISEGRATGRSTPSSIDFEAERCHSFSIDRKLAIVASGRGEGQIRWVAGCETRKRARVEPDWDEAPDATSTIRIVALPQMDFGVMDLEVEYDLEVHYLNSPAQKEGQYGVFADMGLGCYFSGEPGPSADSGGCSPLIVDGLHRRGRIRVHEYGRRDDDLACVPTWLDDDRLTNRPFSIIWQAFGPGVLRGSDDVRLEVIGEGDRDNIGVVAFHTWSKDFRGWRINRIGTALWIGGSLNDTLYDPYLVGNEFGVVVGANEPWGAGFPRWKECYSGFCNPFATDMVAMNFRGGVVEGNTCGNFVMFGGYSGDVDRTFIETGARGSPTYAGHSVIVGAGICDGRTGRSERQDRDRAGQVCGDDRDCPGECVISSGEKRTFAFQWNASMVYNRESPEWFAFVLGKGTRAEYLDPSRSQVQNIRVLGGGFGGERGHPELGTPNGEGLYFFASDGASALMDADDAIGGQHTDHLPPYDHYVSMASKDFERVIEHPAPGRYALGRFMRRATCTGGSVSVIGPVDSSAAWTIRAQPAGSGPAFELIEGGRIARGTHVDDWIRAADLSHPFVPARALASLEISSVTGSPEALVVSLRCFEDKR